MTQATRAADAAPGRMPASHGYFSHEQIMRVLPGLMLAMFLAALDQTIVAIALYSIATDLHGEELMPWLVSGYLVVATVATPIYGKLSDIFGRWPVLRTAIIIYLIASVMSAVSSTMPQLLTFRLLQGLGGGGLIVLVQTIVADIVPRAERGRYQAYLSGVFAAAAVAGPVLGGLLAEYLSWRAVFIFNLPLGVLAWWISQRGLASLPRGMAHPKIDYAGALLLAAALACLMMALMLIGLGGSYLDPMVVAMVMASLALAAALAFCETRASDPILPPALFRNLTVMVCCIVLGANFLVLFGATIMAPLALQTIGGLSAGSLAVYMLPLTLGVPAGSMTSGKVMLRGMLHRRLLTIGSALSAAGSLMLATLAFEHTQWVMVALAVAGWGVGMCIPATMVAVQSAVPSRQIGIVTATSGVFRTLGGAIGIALMSAALFATLAAGTDSSSGLRGPEAIRQLSELPHALLNQGFHRAFAVATLAGILAMLLSRLLAPGAPHSE